MLMIPNTIPEELKNLWVSEILKSTRELTENQKHTIAILEVFPKASS